MTVTVGQIRRVQRPVQTVWGKLFLEPASVRLGHLIATRTHVLPMQLTLASFVLALISAGLFVTATPVAVVAAAIVYQVSTLADALDGTVARVKPGSGSVAALLLDHSLDPWRLVTNVLAVAHSAYLSSGETWPYIAAAAFLAVHFADWTEPRTIRKLRRAYAGAFRPALTALDVCLLRAKRAFARHGFRVIWFGVHERELCVLALGPIAGLAGEAFLVTALVTGLFLALRLRFDVALLRNELVTGGSEYLGDANNAWEAGIGGDGQPSTCPPRTTTGKIR